MPKTAKNVYLKGIWALKANGIPATTGALARQLSVSPASASEMIKKLDAAGLARRRAYHPVELTERGEQIAANMVRKHRIIELFLHRTLSMPWEDVHREAAQWEQCVSEGAIARMDALLGHPQVDVHGHPIPNVDGTVTNPNDVPLSVAPEGPLVVSQVSDADPDVLRTIGELNLRPGSRVSVVGRETSGDLRCRIEGDVRGISPAIAAAIRVIVSQAQEGVDVEGGSQCAHPDVRESEAAAV